MNKSKTIFFSVIIALATATVAYGWTNPTANPPTGSGAMSASSDNVGVASTTPWGKLSATQTGTGGNPAFIVEDSASPDTTPFIIDQAGNVGIGTTAPTSMLHIYSNSVLPKQTIEFGGDSMAYSEYKNSDGTLWIGKTRSTSNGLMTGEIANAGVIVMTTNDALQLGTNDTPRMTILGGGNVGIGTTAPGNLLTVNGTIQGSTLYATAQVAATSITADYLSGSAALNLYAGSASGYMAFSTVGEKMRITSAGNVGIGLTSPDTNYKITTTAGGIKAENSSATQPAGYFDNQSSGPDIQLGAGGIKFSDATIQTTAASGGNLWADRGSNNISNTNSGNVGIGTASPSSSLHVAANKVYSGGYSQILATDATTPTKQLELGFDGTNNIAWLQGRQWSVGYMPLALNPSGGSVGIGTTAPVSPLQVSATNAKPLTGFWHTSITDLTTQGAGVGGGITFLGYKTAQSAMEMFAAVDGYKENATGGNAAGAFRILTQPSTGAGLVERVRIDSVGNVGIGTTAPGSTLHVRKDTNSENNLIIENQTTGTGAGESLYLVDNTSTFTSTAQVTHLNTGYTTNGLLVANRTWFTGTGGEVMLGTRDAKDLIFHTGGFATTNERMRIASGGNVGIGTTGPGGLLDVSKATVGGVTDFRIQNSDNTNTGSNVRNITSVGGASGGDPLLLLNILAVQDWHVGVDNSDSDKFMIGTGGTVGSGNVLTATIAGNVGIGTTAPDANYKLTTVGGGVKAKGSTADSTGFALYTENSTPSPLLVARNDGNVGIGTASPITQLHIPGKVPSAVTGSVAGMAVPNSVYVQGNYAYVVGSETLQIFDVSNPASPVSKGSVATGSAPASVYVQGHYAYVVNYTTNTLQVFDISNSTSPVSVGSVGTGAAPRSVYVQGRYAYVVNYTAGTLQIFDISNPVLPASAGSVATGVNPTSVYVQGRYAYVTNAGTSNTFQIFDISNPALPVSTGSVATNTFPRSVYVQGRYAYIVNSTSNTLQIFDISNPASPASTGSVGTGSAPYAVYVQGRYAYVVNYTAVSTLQIFDVSTPASPVSIGTVSTDSVASYSSVYVQGRYAYVVNSNSDASPNNLKIFDVGGAYIQQLEAGGIQTATLSTISNASVGNDLNVKGGLVVGSGGIYSNAGISASTTSIFGGNVGIGTTTPAYKLDIYGNARVDGNLIVGGLIDIGLEIITNTASQTTSATCTAGKRLLGGGCNAPTGNAASTIHQSYPSANNIWSCRVVGAESVTAYAICGRVE